MAFRPDGRALLTAERSEWLDARDLLADRGMMVDGVIELPAISATVAAAV